MHAAGYNYFPGPPFLPAPMGKFNFGMPAAW